MDKREMCFDCGVKEADPSILGFYEICRQCFDKTCAIMKEYKKNRKYAFPSLDEIVPQLYLGNEDASNDRELLKQKNIQAVLVCGHMLQCPFEDLTYKKFEIADDPRQKISDLFDDGIDYVRGHIENGKNVLVHCAAGVSRSASLVIAYMMKVKGMSFTESHNYVKSKRGVIQPNEGFIEQLKKYEQILKGSK